MGLYDSECRADYRGDNEWRLGGHRFDSRASSDVFSESVNHLEW